MLCLTVLPILGLWAYTVYTLADIIEAKNENESVIYDNELVMNNNESVLRINKFHEISPSTAFQARAVTGRLLCMQRLENAVRIPL